MEQFREKIEQHGVTMEAMGLTPVAARVFIYLMLAPEHKATFEDLVSYFKVSKSAVSNALKMLVATNMAESKTVGGKRKRYFSVNFQNMFSEEQITAKSKMFSNMLDDVRATRGIDDSFSKELANISTLYKMMIVEFPIIIERWKRIIELEKQNKT